MPRKKLAGNVEITGTLAVSKHVSDDIEMNDAEDTSKQPPSEPAWKRYESGEYDQGFKALLESKFLEAEWVSKDNLNPLVENPDLRVHPLLSQSQFRLNDSRDSDTITDSDYKAIQPAVRLASRFLQCGALDDFFYALWKNEYTRFEDPGNNRTFGIQIEAENLRCPDDQTRQEVRKSLEDLAKYTKFCLKLSNAARTSNSTEAGNAGREASDPDDEESNTHTQWVSITNSQNDGFHGWTSVVNIEKKVWDGAIASHKRCQETGDLPNLIGKQFELAVTLVHELAHAYRGARMPIQLDWEPYFGNGNIAEVGFELENALFGGLISRIYEDRGLEAYRYRRTGTKPEKSALQGVFVLWDWPYQYQTDAYTDTAGNYVSGFQCRQEPKEIRALDVAWRVPLEFVRNLLSDDFWEEEYGKYQDPLKPMRDKGYCFRAEDGEVIPVQHGFDQEEEAKYLSEGYQRTSRGKNRGLIVQTRKSKGVGLAVQVKELRAAMEKSWDKPFAVGGKYQSVDLRKVTDKNSSRIEASKVIKGHLRGLEKWLQDARDTSDLVNDRRVRKFFLQNKGE